MTRPPPAAPILTTSQFNRGASLGCRRTPLDFFAHDLRESQYSRGPRLRESCCPVAVTRHGPVQVIEELL